MIFSQSSINIFSRLTWGLHDCGPDIDEEPVKQKYLFRDHEPLMLTLGYAEMRDWDIIVQAVQGSLDNQFAFSFVSAEPPSDKGKPKMYTAHGPAPRHDLLRRLMQSGDEGKIVFDEEINVNVEPKETWRYLVIPGSSEFRTGDLTLLVWRPDWDDREIPVAPRPGPGMSQYSSVYIRLYPTVNSKAHKRQVACAHDIMFESGSHLDYLRKLLPGNDFSKQRDPQYFLRDDLEEGAHQQLTAIHDWMTPDQQAMLEQVFYSGNKIACVQGPPGTGKTVFAAILM